MHLSITYHHNLSASPHKNEEAGIAFVRLYVCAQAYYRTITHRDSDVTAIHARREAWSASTEFRH